MGFLVVVPNSHTPLFFHAAAVKGSTAEGCRWEVTFAPTVEAGPYNIVAYSAPHGTISLEDVLFGDVWICSGQSNMQFTLPQVGLVRLLFVS